MSGVLAQLLPVLVVVLPLLAATLLAAVGSWVARALVDTAALATAALVCLAGCWLAADTGGGRVVRWVGGWTPHEAHSVGIALVADRVAAGLVAGTALLVVATLVASWGHLEQTSGAFQALVLGFLASVSGFVLAGDLFDAFVWFELMGACAVALAGMRVDEPRSVHAALWFGVVNTLAASFALVGVALLYARTGELNLSAVGEQLVGHPGDAVVTTAWALLLVGALVKAAAVPFHFWTADAEAVAPSPVCVLLSGALVAVGVYAVARWWWVVFAAVLPGDATRTLLLVTGTVTALLGGVMCVQQRHLKRLLAYSTISHVGVALLGVGLLDDHGVAAGLGYLAGHACTKGALFLATGVLLERFRTVDEHLLFGRGRGMRPAAVVFVLGGLGLAGAPALGTWAGKSMVEHAQTQTGSAWFVAVVVAAGALTGGSVLRVTARVFAGVGPDPDHDPRAAREASEDQDEDDPTSGAGSPARSRRRAALMLGPAVGLLVLATATAVVPAWHSGLELAAAALVDRDGYDTGVLRPELPVADAVAVSSPLWTSAGVLLGLLTALCAVAVALLPLTGWWAGRRPAALRSTVRPVAVALHRVHRAEVGSQVAWLVLGAGLLAVGLAR